MTGVRRAVVFACPVSEQDPEVDRVARQLPQQRQRRQIAQRPVGDDRQRGGLLITRLRPEHTAGRGPRRDLPEVAALVAGRGGLEADLHAVLELEPPRSACSDRDPVVGCLAVGLLVPASQERMQRRAEGAVAVGVLQRHLPCRQRDSLYLHQRRRCPERRPVIVDELHPVADLEPLPGVVPHSLQGRRAHAVAVGLGQALEPELDAAVVTRPLERRLFGVTAVVHLDPVELVLDAAVTPRRRRGVGARLGFAAGVRAGAERRPAVGDRRCIRETRG